MDNDIDRLFVKTMILTLTLATVSFAVQLVKTLLEYFISKNSVIFPTIDIISLVCVVIAIFLLIMIMIKFIQWYWNDNKEEK